MAARATAVKAPVEGWVKNEKIAADITQVVGNTPMVFLKRVTKVRSTLTELVKLPS